ncbi:MAG: ATP-dependent dethiobiotin synthetase BioD [Sphingomonadaceae bacterium]|nr:ATP-dependent dethiobiotin synthetase BioD [Sphingomonadaceae bacterium]
MTIRIVVSGTDTGIGKTVLAAGLVGALGATYWKPVQAGIEEESDAAAVARLSGRGQDAVLPEAYSLQTPCSPHQAAALDGVAIDPARLALPQLDGPLVVEGAGGVLVPLSDELLYADMFAQWGLPVVLAARTALGTINHSLMSIEALRARHVPIAGIAFIGEENAETQRVICHIGKVRSLGRLPLLDPLNAETLARAMQGFHLDVLGASA